MTPFDFLLKWGPKDHDAMRGFFGDLVTLLRNAEARERGRFITAPTERLSSCGDHTCDICHPIVVPR